MTVQASRPRLEQVGGPSALGGGSRRFFDLLWLMSITEFKRIYFGTVLGYLWSLIRPLLRESNWRESITSPQWIPII